MTPAPRRQTNHRRGFTLVEVTIACALLAAVFIGIGRFVTFWNAARRTAEERDMALRVVENSLESVAAGQPLESTRQHAQSSLDGTFRSPLLDLVAGEPDDAGLTPLRASLSWENAYGERVSPVELTAWVASQTLKEPQP
jgi:prepilin-type N-terminal cleavage/methylation domain-containing protein